MKACKIALLSNLDRRIHNPLGSELVESLPASRFRLTGIRPLVSPPKEPRVHIDRAADRTVEALGEPAGIVVITD